MKSVIVFLSILVICLAQVDVVMDKQITALADKVVRSVQGSYYSNAETPLAMMINLLKTSPAYQQTSKERQDAVDSVIINLCSKIARSIEGSYYSNADTPSTMLFSLLAASSAPQGGSQKRNDAIESIIIALADKITRSIEGSYYSNAETPSKLLYSFLGASPVPERGSQKRDTAIEGIIAALSSKIVRSIQGSYYSNAVLPFEMLVKYSAIPDSTDQGYEKRGNSIEVIITNLGDKIVRSIEGSYYSNADTPLSWLAKVGTIPSATHEGRLSRDATIGGIIAALSAKIIRSVESGYLSNAETPLVMLESMRKIPTATVAGAAKRQKEIEGIISVLSTKSAAAIARSNYSSAKTYNDMIQRLNKTN